MNSINIANEKFRDYVIKTESLSQEVRIRLNNCLAGNKLEDIADDGVSMFRRLRQAEPQSFEESKMLYEVYLAWHQETTKVLRAIDDVEIGPQGIKVFAGEDLRCAFQEVSSFLDDLKERIASLEDFISGNAVSAESFVNEL